MRYPNQQGRGRDRAARDGLTVSETTTTAHRRAVPGFCKGLCAYLRTLPAGCRNRRRANIGSVMYGRKLGLLDWEQNRDRQARQNRKHPTQTHPTNFLLRERASWCQADRQSLPGIILQRAGGRRQHCGGQSAWRRQAVGGGGQKSEREGSQAKQARKERWVPPCQDNGSTHSRCSAAPQLPSGFHFHGTIHAGANQWRWAVAVVGSPRPSVALSVIRQMNGGRRQDRLFCVCPLG